MFTEQLASHSDFKCKKFIQIVQQKIFTLSYIVENNCCMPYICPKS